MLLRFTVLRTRLGSPCLLVRRDVTYRRCPEFPSNNCPHVRFLFILHALVRQSRSNGAPQLKSNLLPRHCMYSRLSARSLHLCLLQFRAAQWLIRDLGGLLDESAWTFNFPAFFLPQIPHFTISFSCDGAVLRQSPLSHSKMYHERPYATPRVWSVEERVFCSRSRLHESQRFGDVTRENGRAAP